MLNLRRKHDFKEWCRFPRGRCTCRNRNTGAVGYIRLQERAEEGYDDEYEAGELEDESGVLPRGGFDADKAVNLVFYNDDASSTFQSVIVEKNLCTSDLCQLLAMKNRQAKSVNWSIIENWSDLGLERLLEDHEYVLQAYKDMVKFSCHARFKFIFRKDFTKYEFFHHPHQFFPSGMLNIDGENDETNFNNHYLQQLVAQEGQCPVIFSNIWIRDEHKKTWSKTYMILREKQLFISQKIESIAKFLRAPKTRAIQMISESRVLGADIQAFGRLTEYHVYTTLNAKNQFRAPTEWGIVLRPSGDATDSTEPSDEQQQQQQLRCLACDSERVRTCWITAMRLAKYGKQLRENYRAFKNKQAESINPKDYNSYSVPNESVRSRVAMDFTGAVGRIVEDPLEANAIAVAEGYSWKRRWRPSSRCSSGPSSGHFQSLEAGVHITQPWFHSGMTRDQATALVSRHGTVDGVFLVRESRSNTGCFVLTYKCGGKVIHAQINPIIDPIREQPVFSLDSGMTKFYDILQLVEFYQLNAGCLPTRLTHYVVQNANSAFHMAVLAQNDKEQPKAEEKHAFARGGHN